MSNINNESVNRSIFLQFLDYCEVKHPYAFSFILSFAIVFFALFYAPSIEIEREDLVISDNLQFIDIDTIQSPKRKVKREITTEVSDIAEEMIKEEKQVEKATGLSEAENAIDIAFHDVAPPRLKGRLKKNMPKLAKEMEVTAKVYLELIIKANGQVAGVKVLRVILSKKNLPDEIKRKLKNLFSIAARNNMSKARYSQPIVNGKNVAIKMAQPLEYELR